MAQKSFDFTASWKKIQADLEKGLPASAAKEATLVYQNAKKYQQTAQQLKAMVYISQLALQVEEDQWQRQAEFFLKEANIANEPAQQLLYSISADIYLAYFEEQRWKIYDRAQTFAQPNDPDTWTAADFQEKINSLYHLSLQNTTLLQKTRLDAFGVMIEKGNTRPLRPTLFDLLAHKALDFWDESPLDVPQPSFAFELNDQASLAPAQTFTKHHYTSADSQSNTLQSLLVLQQLIAFHLQDANPSALIDVDLKRIEFAYQHNVAEGKHQLYKEALAHITSQYPKHAGAAMAKAKLAAHYQSVGEDWNKATGTQEGKMAYALAAKYANEVYNEFSKSEAGVAAYNLLAEIKRPSLQLTVETVNIPQLPFRSLVTYNNLKSIYLRMIPVDPLNQNDENNYENVPFWEKIVAKKSIASWEQKLPAFADHRSHSVEIKVNALPIGSYYLVASANPQFSLDSNVLSAVQFSVSNLSVVQNGKDCFVVDRTSGQPVEAATIQVWQSFYDYKSSKQKNEKAILGKTDSNGHWKMPVLAEKNGYNNRRYFFDIKKTNDQLVTKFFNNYQYDGFSPNERASTIAEQEAKMARYFFFTDRSIYRPGQMLFFKAIGITKDATTNLSKLYQPGAKVVVYLKDANYQSIDTLTIVANKYGSIQGQFKLPLAGLTGDFSLEIPVPNGVESHSFKVEAYKRPTFMVAMEPFKEAATLNKPISTAGNATAFAGYGISNAQVAYRVYRSSRFNTPWWYTGGRGYWPNNGDRKEIAHGTTTTDAQGHFLVSFTPMPDLAIDAANEPVFDYTIEATITDANGETASTENTISIGYRALSMQVFTKGGLYQSLDSNITCIVNTTNSNGLPLGTKVNWQLNALDAPGRLLRKRYWDAPDAQVLSESEFINLFPNDPYKNEDDYQQWAVGKLVYADTINTENRNDIQLQAGSLAPGFYVLKTIGKGKDGLTASSSTYIAVYSASKQLLPALQYQFATENVATVQPEALAVFLSGSSANNRFVIQQVQKKNNEIQWLHYLRPSNAIQNNRFLAEENDRGGFFIHQMYVLNNRVYTNDWQVQVPWKNKDLNIRFETFRSKLSPGQSETWKVHITGAEGEKLGAELLASMYDASLDQFVPHQWQLPAIWPENTSHQAFIFQSNFGKANGTNFLPNLQYLSFDKRYDVLRSFGDFRLNYFIRREHLMAGYVSKQSMKGYADFAPPKVFTDSNIAVKSVEGKAEDGVVGEENYDKVFSPPPPPSSKEKSGSNKLSEQIQVRKNFAETAFFLPQLETQPDGSISFGCTMPEALTQWKMQLLAHTADLKLGGITHNILTQKELMVQTNAPRFFRQGDQLELGTRVVNLSTAELTGQIELQLFNAATGTPVDGWFKNMMPHQYFTVAAGQSIAVKFPMEIPYLYNEALIFKVVATAGNFSDGEEVEVPVLTNRLLVTATFPLQLRGDTAKNFYWADFNRLMQESNPAGNGNTLQTSKLTVEYTSNPAWLAVQSLPYLMEYPYECAEQSWNRLYANLLAQHITQQSPKLQAVFKSWLANGSDALASNLSLRQELKSILLEETPWVLAAKTESEQKRQVAQLFDLAKMSEQSSKTLAHLQEMQTPEGGFVWFKGGLPDRFITQYILTGIGRLYQMKINYGSQQDAIQEILKKALPYVDQAILNDYQRIIKNKKQDKLQVQPDPTVLQYLYMRSFFKKVPLAPATVIAITYFTNQAKKYWVSFSKQQQAMLAITLYRSGDKQFPSTILASLKENSIYNEDLGRYWKEYNRPNGFWWQAPIECQAVMIAAFAEIAQDNSIVDELKTWLLLQKQTQQWHSTMATADAVYALLMQGSNWLSQTPTVTIQLGGQTISSTQHSEEAGTGYFKTVIQADNVTPSMANISVKMALPSFAQSTSPSWGALYWQYFQDADKVTASANGVKISKQLYRVQNSDKGPQLTDISSQTPLKIGDKVKVRLVIKSDRNLEYVHIKDMRASCFEPLQVLSGYRYQGGLGYYESTTDAATHFFINNLGIGVYVMEYDVRVTHSGQFSNGITSVQCLYAPQFASHTQGISVQVSD